MTSSTAIAVGSIAAVASAENRSIAETFGDAEIIVIADTSGSMSTCDSINEQSRYQVLLEELGKLQTEMPGKIAVCNFASSVQWSPGGLPKFLGTLTDLAGALRFAKIADAPGRQFILISDGIPDDMFAAIAEARKYEQKISCVYVGPANGIGSEGQQFLEELAQVSGGQSATADRARDLAAIIKPMLLEAGQ